jgi:hypothetical protein
MRVALKLVTRTLNLNWGYAPVSSLGRSLFYQSFSKALEKKSYYGTPNNRFSFLRDPRNLSSRWLVIRKHLTPLAATEKRAVSGFDTRLVSLKSPKKIKLDRRRGLSSFYSSGVTKGGYGQSLSPTSVLLPFISQAPGWGPRSSKRLNYLKESSFLVLKKSSNIGFISREPLPTNLLAMAKGLFLENGEEGEEGGEGAVGKVLFLFGVDIFLSNRLLLERAYSIGSGESPNLPQSMENSFSLEELESPLKESLS